MAEKIVSPKIYLLVFGVLLLFTYSTYRIAFIDLGAMNTVMALVIAMSKALLVILFFMHLRYSKRLTWIVAAGGLFWLGIMLALTLTDYLTRGLSMTAGK